MIKDWRDPDIFPNGFIEQSALFIASIANSSWQFMDSWLDWLGGILTAPAVVIDEYFFGDSGVGRMFSGDSAIGLSIAGGSIAGRVVNLFCRANGELIDHSLTSRTFTEGVK